ncbi:CHY zinc finger family protein [Streptococcus criceti]|uniref:CHY zinc finger family protein n=1 Tax=Streptococcus criceti HS-6 TaxID=873449 RepID=G5JN84_STRCG|nr:CHY zinc finger protein [Streptococcus criceti]EHI75189.1 CHY zinc finger family protein [Streptococcus criceti HS-6]SUN41634.1 CHY zinc finger family protein [Streptococcus criceti]
MLEILGLDLDRAGRCQHYHGLNDILALKCRDCQRFYACYQCHDALCNHPFKAMDKREVELVLCGNCRSLLNWQDYQTGACPSCQHAFNPNCSRHHAIYFE